VTVETETFGGLPTTETGSSCEAQTRSDATASTASGSAHGRASSRTVTPEVAGSSPVAPEFPPALLAPLEVRQEGLARRHCNQLSSVLRNALEDDA
jgi:hypothetical protein